MKKTWQAWSDRSSFSPMQLNRQSISTKEWGVTYFYSKQNLCYALNIEPNNLVFLKTSSNTLDESDNIESNICVSKQYTIRNKRQS